MRSQYALSWSQNYLPLMEPEFHLQINKNLPTVPIVTHISPFQIRQTYISNIPQLGPRPVLVGLVVDKVAWELTYP